jgi:pimeloyl-ACP methyl ester carboxylesterase
LNKRSNTSKQARLLVVPHAGHQLMIDNPGGFHDAVREALADHEE